MLYLGNNASALKPVSYDETGKPVYSAQAQNVLNDINNFDQVKSIAKQSLHYSEFCNKLSTEDTPGFIAPLISTIASGLENLASFGVSEANQTFLQDSVSGLAGNFEDAATSAKRRAREKEATMQAAQQAQMAKKEDNMQGQQGVVAQQVEQQPFSSPEPFSDVSQTVDNAMNKLHDSKFDDKTFKDNVQNSGKTNNASVSSIFNAKDKEKTTVASVDTSKTDVKTDTSSIKTSATASKLDIKAA